MRDNCVASLFWLTRLRRRVNLAAAGLRHIAGTPWSTKRYLNIELLKEQNMRGAIIA